MPPERGVPRGLYAVTEPGARGSGNLLAAVERALRGGAAMVQYRNKHAEESARMREAAALNSLCRQYAVPLIVNDDPRIARRVGAAGVHVGRDDQSVAAVRELVGATAIIGASCYDRLDLAIAAVAAGADYVAFGSFFTSATKPQAAHAPLSLLRAAKNTLSVPLVAIGGITLDNAPVLVDAGADLVAVISALFGCDDVEAAARSFAKLYRV